MHPLAHPQMRQMLGWCCTEKPACLHGLLGVAGVRSMFFSVKCFFVCFFNSWKWVCQCGCWMCKSAFSNFLQCPFPLPSNIWLPTWPLTFTSPPPVSTLRLQNFPLCFWVSLLDPSNKLHACLCLWAVLLAIYLLCCRLYPTVVYVMIAATITDKMLQMKIKMVKHEGRCTLSRFFFF